MLNLFSRGASGGERAKESEGTSRSHTTLCGAGCGYTKGLKGSAGKFSRRCVWLRTCPFAELTRGETAQRIHTSQERSS